MAIVQSMWLAGTKKKLGGTVIYQAMGQTRQRELAAEVSNPRTTQQMTQRVKWSNLVNLYRANRSWMKYAFETKKTSQSEYNKFMSLNVTASVIYLPKDVAAAGGCVVNDYIVTQGSLSSIETTKVANGWASNIFIPSTFQLTETTTVAQLAEAVLPLNPGINEGDQLSFIRMTQQVNGATGIPFVIVRKYEVIISSADTRYVGAFLPLDYITTFTQGQERSLGVLDSGNAGGFVLILSRTIGGRTYVSTQRIIVANNQATVSNYTGAAALQRAIDSYGESDEPFLTTSTANQNTQAPTPPSILEASVDGVTWAPGSLQTFPDGMPGRAISVAFSESLEATSAVVILYGKENGQVYATDPITAYVNGTDVEISNAPTEADQVDNMDAYKIAVIAAGVTYEIVFADHGLE